MCIKLVGLKKKQRAPSRLLLILAHHRNVTYIYHFPVCIHDEKKGKDTKDRMENSYR